jgi:hypothetical protein
MKTSDLLGPALDWAVAKITNPEWWNDGYMTGDPIAALDMDDGSVYSPSTDWSQGGPIIEREEIALEPMTHDEHGDGWLATRVEGPAVCMEFGPTMLIAAMRCYVAACLGDEIELPEELK